MAILYGFIGRSPQPGVNVQTPGGQVPVANAPTPADQIRDFLGKIAAYVPGEVISIFLIGKAIFPGDEGKRIVGIWAVICWVIAIISRWIGTKGSGKAVNVILTSLAFPIWVMAIGGTILGFTFGEQITTLIVLAFSVLAGIIYNNK